MEETQTKLDNEAEFSDEYDYSDINLRLLDLADVDDFMEYATDERANKFYDYSFIRSKEDAADFIVNRIIFHPWCRAICFKNRVIGEVVVTPNDGIYECRGEISYVLGSKYWGRGIATRAVKMVAWTIFYDWPHLERLEALVDVENFPSQRVLEKVGFQREAVLRKCCWQKRQPRDMVMFSLLSTDPPVKFFS